MEKTIFVNPMKSCQCSLSRTCYRTLKGSYIGEDRESPEIIAAIIEIAGDFKTYQERCRKQYKGNVIRDAKKSDTKGYITKVFMPAHWALDIYAINHSLETRSGGPMKDSYKATANELRKRFADFKGVPECDNHWQLFFGIFKTGDLKLIAYINLTRIGDLAFYSQILGHGDYLKDGIMYKMHFDILEKLIFPGKDWFEGIKTLMYGGWLSGNEGLKLWKKKTLFEPANLITS